MFTEDLFEKKRFLVTGGGSGLGRHMVEKLLSLGAGEVAICGRRLGVLEETAGELGAKYGGKVTPYEADIRDAGAVDTMIGKIFESGPLDGLVNNAAGNFVARSEELSVRGFDAIANIVLHGTFYVTQACGRRWLAGGNPGAVVSIVVTWVRTGSPFVVPSAAAKAGVAAMTQSLAVEWGPRSIRLNAIAPGYIPTEGMERRLMPLPGMTKSEEQIPLRRSGKPEELANLVAFLLSDGCGYMTGEVIAMDGGAWMVNPGGFARFTELTDEDWEKIRQTARKQDSKDKESGK